MYSPEVFGSACNKLSHTLSIGDTIINQHDNIKYKIIFITYRRIGSYTFGTGYVPSCIFYSDYNDTNIEYRCSGSLLEYQINFINDRFLKDFKRHYNIKFWIKISNIKIKI